MEKQLNEHNIEKIKSWGTATLQAPMYRYTSFQTGGPAELLVEPQGRDDIAAIMSYCHENNLDVTIIGGGSNLLVGDRGIPGVVVRIARDVSGAEDYDYDGKNGVRASAFISKEVFINQSLNRGLGDVLFSVGIPGMVGGGLYMNAGTWMGSFADITESVEIVTPRGEMITFTINKEEATYRSMGVPSGSVVLSGNFRLPVTGDPAALMKERDDIIADRESKHPLSYPSAGSVFKNPEGHSSWKLVNDSGLKGKTMGGAQVSELHTNFIINRGGATSADIRNLIEHVQIRVAEEFGISLEAEVRMVGLF